MMLIFKRKLLYIFFFIPFSLFSSESDTSKVSNITPTSYYFNQSQFEYRDSINHIDSSLNNFQNYIPFNHLGNSGLAYNDLFYHSDSNYGNFGFNYFKNNYSAYFFSPQKIKFYTTRSPYTNLFYATGSKKEQVFKLTFSYNIKKNWNITFDFNRIRSDGFYARQSTNDNAVDITSNYKSLNNRYYLLSALIYNSAKNSENGGLIKDSTIGAVNLNTAKRATNQKSVFFKQYFNLGKKSTDTTHLNIIEQPTSRFILTSLFDNIILKYQDSDTTSSFYSNDYIKTNGNNKTVTYDSVFNYKIENEFAWKRLDNKQHRGLKDIIGTSFSVKHQFVELKQQHSNFTFNNFILGAEMYNTYTKNKCWWNIGSKYTLSGYNKNNYIISGILKKEINDSLTMVTIGIEQKSQAPDFIYNHYYSNHFIWNNNFSSTISTSINASVLLRKIKLYFGADYSIYQNVLYFNESALAAQYNKAIPVFHAFLKKDFRLYNWHLHNTINYQLVSDSSVIRLPEFVLEHSLFYAKSVFKKVVNFQIGASVFYVSSYYANAYMPATAQFYLQNTTQCGNYPAINFFINAQVKTVRVFFKIDNLNQGWMFNDYVLTPNYTMNGRAFKFGVSWLFFD